MPTAFPFRAVIFDMDGVIVDTEAAYIVEQRVFLDEHGIDVPTEELNAMVGTSHQTFVNALVDWWERGGYGTFTPDEAYARFEEWSSRYVYHYRDLLNPGVVETLDELARAACASRSPRRHAWTTSSTCSASAASPTASR